MVRTERVSIETLVATERTQNRERVEELAVCMRKHGWGNIPPVAIVPTVNGNDIWDGHHRVLAARKAGITTVPTVNRLAMSRQDAAAYRRRVNRWRKQKGC